ncbi:hypothetical protein QC761_0071050 [Podospora bellae-mahoneyi]|uniref:Uncharacterized protein n=1 Tax=Podospora bellae-mahoneyi TaxID=2093777 RepID=A0ABR0FIG2_9PEZI|nr:hypothetical protein QC761_0071050 [Podospora bellae-mahoneyi]
MSIPSHEQPSRLKTQVEPRHQHSLYHCLLDNMAIIDLIHLLVFYAYFVWVIVYILRQAMEPEVVHDRGTEEIRKGYAEWAAKPNTKDNLCET